MVRTFVACMIALMKRQIYLAAALILTACSALASTRTITVAGNSMRPTYQSGARVSIAPIQWSALRVGDIIVFADPRGGSGKIIHRVVEIRGSKVWTKGDGNARRDRFWVLPVHVVGKVQ